MAGCRFPELGFQEKDVPLTIQTRLSFALILPYCRNMRTRLPTGVCASTTAHTSAYLLLHSYPCSASWWLAKAAGETMDWKHLLA
jgi:hypothetical protein